MAAATMLLVHGGAHGAWCWQPTLDVLSTPAVAVELPPRAIRGKPQTVAPPAETARLGIADFADAVIAGADAAALESFVLVGHSMGGLTVAEVARRVPGRVRHLVFVSCIVPPEGATMIDSLPEAVREMTRQSLGRAQGGDFSLGIGMSDELKRFMFCNDMDEAQARFVLERCGHECPTPFLETVSRAGLPPALPKTYVRLLRDQALSPEDQDRQIANLRAAPGGSVAVVELDTGHDVMVSAPGALAEVLERIAAASA
jgi:pimeloyl-ACP methyl ester carboxylesterase